MPQQARPLNAPRDEKRPRLGIWQSRKISFGLHLRVLISFGFVLPASPECLVKRDHRQELVALSAGKVKFRRKQLLLRFQNFIESALPAT